MDRWDSLARPVADLGPGGTHGSNAAEGDVGSRPAPPRRKMAGHVAGRTTTMKFGLFRRGAGAGRAGG